MNKRGFLDIPFAWVFAILAGSFILVLAIYGATKILNTGDEVQSAKTGKEVGILLNPLEIGYETGKTTSFSLPAETRIYNNCDDDGVFGMQFIKISQKSFNKWTETDVNTGFENKYLLSKRPVEGKEFYLFSKPFEFPFKVADLIYMTSSLDNYCFVNPPESIEDELSSLKQKNIVIDDCSEEDIKICFNNAQDCDVQVNYNGGYVKKNQTRVYFEGDALMYAGVFSNLEVYECQLKRLMKKTGSLAQLYIDKANFISRKDCDSNLNDALLQLVSLTNNFHGSSEIVGVFNLAENIEDRNKLAVCRLW